MSTTYRHLIDQISSNGQISAVSLPALYELLDQYPYFHLARLTLLRILYQQREPAFNAELRRSALYLPSRETIFGFVESDRMVPREEKSSASFGGAILSRKPNERLGHAVLDTDSDRTGSLIDSFLSSIPSTESSTEHPVVPLHRGRADATTDYISYMLEEEMTMQVGVSAVETPIAEQTSREAPIVMSEDTGTTELIDKFIRKQGEHRIKLKEKSDSDLRKPTLNSDSVPQKGAFTETLARIYIKQGKFEHAIEIIRRLSLKYPKKNRYFADQIRFLEKIIANNKAKESQGEIEFGQ